MCLIRETNGGEKRILMANKRHLVILRQGVKVWNKWREIPYPPPDAFDLLKKDPFRTNLRGAKIANVLELTIAYILKAQIRDAFLKKADLSLVFPFMALNFVWVTILSSVFLHEPIFWNKWVGIALIVIGVASIGRGAK